MIAYHYAAYKTWRSMKRRCAGTATNSRYYTNVKVCDRWLDFSVFLDDMGERPEGMTLDRIDVNGNYEKDNCRWATVTQQMRNKRSNRVIEFNGVSMCMAEWSETLGVDPNTIRARIKKGWPMDQVLRDKSVRHHVSGERQKVA